MKEWAKQWAQDILDSIWSEMKADFVGMFGDIIDIASILATAYAIFCLFLYMLHGKATTKFFKYFYVSMIALIVLRLWRWQMG